MDFENLLDEIDGRLTRLTLHHSDTRLFVWSLQKHIRHALQNPTQVDQPKFLREMKGKATAMAVKYPNLSEHFFPVVQKISEYESG